PAAFGRNLGATVNAISKSGGNGWHGSAQGWLNTSHLNARNFFDLADNNRDGKLDRPVYQQNQYGFTLGGRLWKDRTFFFGNGEWLRLRVPQSRTLTVPTAKMRAGDFSEFGDGSATTTTDVDLRNPFATGRPIFAGNVIPQALWNAVSKDVLALLPQANRAGLSGNLATAPSFRNRTNQFNVRLDHRFSEKDTLYGRYIFSNITAYSPFGAITQGTRGGAALPGFGWDLTTDNRNLAVNYQRVWTSRLITEFRFGYNETFGGQEHQNVGNDIGVRNKIAGITGFADNERGVPRFSITGISPFGDEPNTIIRQNKDFQYDFSASYTLNQHQFKFGGSFQTVKFAPSIQNIVRGSYTFANSTVSSGVPFADFMLGFPTGGASSGAVADADFRGNEYYWFAQDSWRARSNLTLTYGLRYEYQQPLVDQFLNVANFALNSRTIIIPYKGDRLGGPFVSGTLAGGFSGLGNFPIVPAYKLGLGPGLIRRDKNNYGPRFGFAWNALKDERLIVRGGYGLYYNRKEQFAASTMAARPPFGFSGSLVAPTQPCLNLTTGVAVACTTPGAAPIQIENALTTFTPSAILLPVDTDLRTGYVQQWNLTTQTKFWKNYVFELGYVGSKGTRLFGIDSRNYRPASAVALPNTSREFSPYAFGMAVWDDGGASTYNSLQLRLVKRLSNGLQFSSNYTWAHSIDNNSAGASGSNDSDSGGSSNPNNRAAEKARSAFDARHRFVISSVYELPFGPGRKFGAGAQGAAKKLAEGWQFGLIASWRSANPFTVDSTFDFSNIGRASSNRPDLGGNPNAGPKTAERWFNTTAFVNPVRGVFGNAGRNIVNGDTFTSVDFSLLKDTTLTEKVKLQFRAELFNVGNHTNFGSPNRTYAPVAAGYTAGVSANTNPDFGRMFGAADPRVAQLALKLVF
ncbi:MAG: hypothetical protein HOP19_11595, partial [Acidobacteria bacterium]|nr:hypothetical protein [Acidobacteriota bacterium]